ncbi:tetratricopeptide repeat protein [Asticcacaulis sp. YBE204]|uniref:tetratricopeptide repeat protein n=1 Tax=Asticcacaulis sp. YBE204 TaxID=1282363 RepID=UPI0003C4076E|nr:tetratricopeptide repeat protein [Asticcacaulis sp. YBE204]ESQ76508.1 hypothetical protein AEYBE204_19135 [Asticcacaulis sp. YBE204]
MALTDEPKRKPLTPLGWVLRIALFAVPLIVAGVLMWQTNARWQNVKIYKTAFDYELEYAKLGVLNSQFYVAEAYDNGFQTDVNKAEAVNWYRKAAYQSHAKSQYELGQHYLDGEGIARDDAEGFRWVQKAAFKDYPEGQLRAGQLLCEGRGVAADCVKGVELIEKAVGQGLPAAQAEMAARYERGEGVPKDAVKAWVLYALAHEALTWEQKEAPPSADVARVEATLTKAQLASAKTQFEARRPKREKPGKDKVAAF